MVGENKNMNYIIVHPTNFKGIAFFDNERDADKYARDYLTSSLLRKVDHLALVITAEELKDCYSQHAAAKEYSLINKMLYVKVYDKTPDKMFDA